MTVSYRINKKLTCHWSRSGKAMHPVCGVKIFYNVAIGHGKWEESLVTCKKCLAILKKEIV